MGTKLSIIKIKFPRRNYDKFFGSSDFWDTVIKGVGETSRRALTLNSEKRAGSGMFKVSKDFYREDQIYEGSCGV